MDTRSGSQPSGKAAPAHVLGVCVTFEPGARTELRPGDVIWCAPGEKYWHGATATTAMTHIAIREQLDGKTADWMEQVSGDQYKGSE